jgi:class 3 adenylate cyclase
MTDRETIRQALAILRRDNRLSPDVLATIAAVFEEQAADTEARTEPVAGPSPPTERRPVTVLFAEVSGYAGAGDATTLGEIRALWRRIDQTIVAHGGIIDKHMGDIVLAVFGVPTASENDAERAVRCALTITQLVEVTRARDEQLAGLAARAGLNSGLVSVGTVGNDGSTTVIGDAVNVASRLREGAGSGDVVLGETTFRLVEPLYEVEPLGPRPIKGRQTPVPAYRVVAPRPRLFFTSGRGVLGVSPPMIGREEEMAELQATVRGAAEAGRGRLFLITGEAGVGKSRLAAEFHAWLRTAAPEMVVFHGRSDQRLQHTSFSLMRDLLMSFFRILDSDAPDVAEARLLEALRALQQATAGALPPLWRERVRAVARLVGLSLVAPTAADALPGRVTVGQAQDDILAFFALMAADHGAVVFLEDVHWADEDSLDLLERLGTLAESAPLVVVALARPQLYERRPARRPEAGGPTSLNLRPLPPDESHTLAREILRQLAGAPDSLFDLIVRAAGGNPFYMEELVKVLIGDGAIVADGGEWRLSVAEPDRLRIPDTLAGILQARLDRLPGLERTILQQAAVVGDEFWDGSVRQINAAAREPAAPEAVAEALRALAGREMIYRAPLSAFTGAQAYQFRHAALREAAYSSILLRDRPFYHTAAAKWLEAQSGDRLAEYAAPIAEHYELAGDRERAAALYELAGRRATGQQRPGRAAQYYGRALTLLQRFPHQIERRLTLYRALGQAWLSKGQTADALVTFRAMEEAAESAGDLLEQARAALAQVTLYRELGQPATALEAAQRAAQIAALTGAADELAQAERAVEALRLIRPD